MYSIFGGVIGSPPEEKAITLGSFPAPPGSLLVANGRSALELIARRVRARRVWMPSYFCRTMVTPAMGDVAFYGLDRSLRCDDLALVGPGDLVILVNYFGLPCDRSVWDRVHERGAKVVEDASMGLFTPHCGESDYLVKSLAKNLGVADGAVLWSKEPMGDMPLLEPYAPWVEACRAARNERRSFDLGQSDSRDWFSIFAGAKALSPCGPYKISGQSEVQLGGYDYHLLRSRQEANWSLLWGALGSISPLIPAATQWSPGGFFPIVVEDRDFVREWLFSQRIYPAVHWTLSWAGGDFEDSRWLSSRILSIPCDWRYDESDMEFISECVKKIVPYP